MVRRSILGLLMVGMAALSPSSAPAVPNVPPRIVAVGDLHGDFDAWQAIARAAGLIDPSGHWSGGRAILVQTGDLVDRGPDSLKIVRHLMQLEREAKAAGGRVAVLVGNHEAMMITGDLRYTVPGEFAAFADAKSDKRRAEVFASNRAAIEQGYRRADPALSPAVIRDRWLAATPLGMIEHQRAWSPEGEIGRWTIGHPAVLKIGDTLFVHGGLSPAYAPLSLDDINRRVAAALRAREVEPTSIINDPLGPLWYRGLAGLAAEGTTAAPPPQAVSAELAALLAARNARRIVIGHTPLPSGVAVIEGGRLARIDSGISRAYGGKPGYLEIAGGQAFARSVPRPAATAAAR